MMPTRVAVPSGAHRSAPNPKGHALGNFDVNGDPLWTTPKDAERSDETRRCRNRQWDLAKGVAGLDGWCPGMTHRVTSERSEATALRVRPWPASTPSRTYRPDDGDEDSQVKS